MSWQTAMMRSMEMDFWKVQKRPVRASHDRPPLLGHVSSRVYCRAKLRGWGEEQS
jgi:hypothetical protein